MTDFLIDTKTLAARLTDRNNVILDCRYQLTTPDAGRQAYDAGHITGAYYLDLAKDLSGIPTGGNGRHPLPKAAVLAATFAACGVRNDLHVIVYDDMTGIFAARCWWLLRWLGHDNVSVLDGGFQRWVANNLPVSTVVPTRRNDGVFQFTERSDSVVTVHEVTAALTAGTLIDARAAERWRGEVEPIDPVKGRIPGAKNHPHEHNLQADGKLRPPNELRAGFAALSPAKNTIHYCGSGVSACHNILALYAAGLDGGRLYPGSWSEWSADEHRPIERDTTI